MQRLAYAAACDIDRHMAKNLPDCDALVALSGCSLEAGRVARRRGIRHVCERGASHIRVQDRLLQREADRWGLRRSPTLPAAIEREEAEYAEADRIMVLTRYIRDSFIAEGVTADRLRLLMPAPRLWTDGQVQPMPGDGFHVLFIGAVALTKGIGYLIQGFRRAAIPGATLSVIGVHGPHATQLLAQYDETTTHIVGPVPRVRIPEYLARCHVLVLPSIDDGSGLVVAEAMAAGRPVVVSQGAGAHEWVRPGIDGLVVPPGDGDAIAEALTWLAADRDRLGAMGQAAHDGIRQQVGLPADYVERWLAAVLGP
jgi:glycosyltransferase involved in cell wall biosynthesis